MHMYMNACTDVCIYMNTNTWLVISSGWSTNEFFLSVGKWRCLSRVIPFFRGLYVAKLAPEAVIWVFLGLVSEQHFWRCIGLKPAMGTEHT